ncbi:retrovirus-related Pol polyprotein from transposon 17.6 [Trichonephila clavipes]|nr:retrovirus-related Pol polyprotein from transposon 17.6 [Trichonephila clavipes]
MFRYWEVILRRKSRNVLGSRKKYRSIEKFTIKRFVIRNKYDVGQLRVEPQRILLKSDLPVHLRPYRTSHIQEKEIKSQVEKCLQAVVIKESNSPYSAPVTLAFKRDDG